MNQNSGGEQPGSAETQSLSEFVPVQGGEETTSAESLLIAAYVLMWVAVFVFVFLAWRRQLALKRDLDRLERALGESARAKAATDAD